MRFASGRQQKQHEIVIWSAQTVATSCLNMRKMRLRESVFEKHLPLSKDHLFRPNDGRPPEIDPLGRRESRCRRKMPRTIWRGECFAPQFDSANISPMIRQDFFFRMSEKWVQLRAGGKPSTWLPPGGLVERLQTSQQSCFLCKNPTQNDAETSQHHPTQDCEKWKSEKKSTT